MQLKHSLLAAALSLAIAPAFAKEKDKDKDDVVVVVVPAVACADSVATTGNAGYLACQGSFEGNIAPGQVNAATFMGMTFNLVGKSDDAGNGPFTSDPGTTSGVLTFDAPQTGMFVLGLKGGPTYSFYLFDGGTTGISSLNFDTLGIAKGNGQPGPGLSHGALLTKPVPEPETYALMLAGLAVVGFVARRRRA